MNLAVVEYITKNWALYSHDVKGFAFGSFLERIIVERANDDLC